MLNFSSGGKSFSLEGEVHPSRHEPGSYLSEPSVGRVLFIVSGNLYKGVESQWDFLCATYPEEQPIAVDPSLKAELDAWEAASDEISENPDSPEV